MNIISTAYQPTTIADIQIQLDSLVCSSLKELSFAPRGTQQPGTSKIKDQIHQPEMNKIPICNIFSHLYIKYKPYLAEITSQQSAMGTLRFQKGKQQIH